MRIRVFRYLLVLSTIININAACAQFDAAGELPSMINDLGLTRQELIIAENSSLNAYVDKQGRLIISTALLKFIGNRDELAFVLAHELAHVELRHNTNSALAQTDVENYQQELQADKHALLLLKQKNFNPHSGAQLISRLAEHFAQIRYRENIFLKKRATLLSLNFSAVVQKTSSN